jgi:hypothetical protein
VVNGKRAISKAQAKALAEFFNVNPGVFIWKTRRDRIKIGGWNRY